MFEKSKFNGNISKWNVSNVINMGSMFKNSKFNQDINNWFIKLNKKCRLKNFIKIKNFEINSYEDFKQYHRQMILEKL